MNRAIFLSVYPFLVYRFSLDEKQKGFAGETVSKIIISAKKRLGFK
jgi:hypothetical protein